MRESLAVTELTFLVDLLLHHDLPKETKDVVAARIGVVESNLQYHLSIMQKPKEVPLHFNNTGPRQAASTLALMQKHGDIAPVMMPEIPAIVPVEHVAQTPQAAAGVNHRNNLINKAVNQNRDMVDTGKGTKGPRKW